MNAVLGLILLTIGFGATQLHLANCVRELRVTQAEGKPQYWGANLNSQFVKKFLGMRIVVSDLVWFDIMIKSDLEKERSGFSSLYTAIKTMLDLDPANFYGAWYGALYLSVIKDDIKGASKLFEEAVVALEQTPSVDPKVRGSIYFAYGYHLIFEENDIAKAAKYIKQSAEVAGAPEFAKHLSESLSTEKGRVTIGFNILNQSYRRARSAQERSIVEEKMTRLLVKKDLIELQEQFDRFRERTGSHEVPIRRLFQVFLRSIHHSGKDPLGRRFEVDEKGSVYHGRSD